MSDEVKFFKGPVEVRKDDGTVVQEQKLKIERMIDKYSSKAEEATKEDIEKYPAEYQLYELSDGGNMAVEDALRRSLEEIKRLKKENEDLKATRDQAAKSHQQPQLPEARLENVIEEIHEDKRAGGKYFQKGK